MSEPVQAPPELEEGYYARNFEAVLATVEERYGDLLRPEEAAYATALADLDESALRLYVRLVLRKGPCFRLDLLSYDEIPDLDAAARELEDAGLLDRAEDAPLEDLLAVLRRPELVDLVRDLPALDDRGARSLRRPELLELLDAADSDAVRGLVHDRYEILRPLGGEHLRVFRLLFFGNLGQDLSEFVVSELGIVRYEPYPLSREHRLFQDREDLDQALAVRAVRDHMYALLAEEQLDEALEAARSVLAGAEDRREVARRHAESILLRVGRELERADRPEDAVELYAGARRPPARERLCRVLDRLERREEALELCAEMRERPRDETETGFVPFFEHRLKRKLGLTQKPWRRPRRPTTELQVERGPKSVESLALEALAAEGRPGLHSENWLWHSLFGLAFWDVIFAPVPGVFHHPFQVGPLDLQGPEFRTRRRPHIEERLEELTAETDLAERLLPIYQAKAGIANALVPWQFDIESPLRFALEHIDGPTLAVVSNRLSRHLRRYRRGLPDLLVHAPDTPLGFELLEVKGPGDQLRPEQGAWIDFLNEHSIPTRILKVTWR